MKYQLFITTDSIVGTSGNLDDLETDNEGQLIIYTSIYRWKDGTYHSEAENDGD